MQQIYVLRYNVAILIRSSAVERYNWKKGCDPNLSPFPINCLSMLYRSFSLLDNKFNASETRSQRVDITPIRFAWPVQNPCPTGGTTRLGPRDVQISRPDPLADENNPWWLQHKSHIVKTHDDFRQNVFLRSPKLQS